jgi:hypothetical protein
MRTLLAALMIAASFAAHAQSSGSGGSMGSGGSSGSLRTERAPSGTMRTGPDQSNPGGGSPTMGGGTGSTPESGVAPGSSGRGGQQAQFPDLCQGPISDPSCAGAGDPTGTGLGDRGTGRGPKDRYGPEDSPVKGGPSFSGPTGRPLDLPQEGR